MTDELKLLLQEILAPIKDNFTYLFLAGSSLFPFLNAHDIDVIIVSDTAEQRKECIDYFKNNINRQELREKYSLDFHFRIEEYQTSVMNYPSNPAYKQENWYNFLTDSEVKEMSIEEFLAQWDQYMTHIKERVEREKVLTEEHRLRQKYWYYLLTTLYVVKNNSIEFTSEQQQNIIILHDRKEEQIKERKNLINQIIQEVDSWQIN